MQYTQKQSMRILSKSVIQYIWHYLSPYRGKLFIALIALLLSSSSVLLLTKSFGYFIDEMINEGGSGALNIGLTSFLIVVFILAISTSIRFRFITIIGEYAIRDIRKDIYKKILDLSPGFYESNKSGDILSRLTVDTTILQSAIDSSISIAARNLVMLVGCIIMLLLSSWKLTLTIIIAVPMIVAPIIFFVRRIRKLSKKAQEEVANIASASEETVNFIRIIQAYNQEQKQIQYFNQQLQNAIIASNARINARAFLTALIMILAFGAISIILWIGMQDVLNGNMSSGDLSSFMILSVVCASTVAALTEVISQIQRAAGASDRIADFLSTKPDIQSKANANVMPNDIKGVVEFKNVNFSYPSNQEKLTLNNISFKVEPGSMLALVGESGAGKSTIMQVLLRFYDINSGSIEIDGYNIQDVTLNSLRNNFAYVGQDPVIFSTSVIENILYGSPDASKEDAINAAKAAAALEFIEKMPYGMDTFLGEKGARLSGGQKQRISIARAILRKSKILLLDEATSALDSKNEQLIQEAIQSLVKDRTTIVIAHRLSTIKNADYVITLQDGKIIQNTKKEE